MISNSEKIAKIILKETADIFLNEVKDTKVGYLTITDCEVTSDLSYAYIYYTLIGDDKKLDVTKKALEKSKGFVRKTLASRIKNLRKMPELVFKYDNSLAYGNKITEILDKLDIKKDEDEE